MSELKVYKDLDDYIGYDDTPPMMYDKSETDKVIEAKDKEIRKLKEQVALLQAEFVPQPGV